MFQGRTGAGSLRALIKTLSLTVVAALAFGAIAAQAGIAGYISGGDDDSGYSDGDGYGGGGYGDEADDDETAPKLTVRKPAALKRKAALKGGIVLNLKCSEACKVRANVSIDRKSAKRMGFIRPGTQLGASTATLATWWDKLPVKLNAKGKKVLKKSKKGAVLIVTLSAVDGAGNRSVPVVQKLVVR